MVIDASGPNPISNPMMRRRPELALALTAFAALALMLALPASAKKAKPLPCTPPANARFVQAGRPIIAGQTTTADAVSIAGTTVSIGSACTSAPVKLQPKKGFTLVTAKWAPCGGLKGKVKLNAKLNAPGCDRLVGTVRAKKFTGAISATLSRCGDGIPDAGGGEQCDGGGCSEGEGCQDDCTCATVTTTSTSTSTSTTSTTIPCCAAERMTLTSGAGSITIASLVPFPFPAGIVTVLDSGPTVVGRPECRHDVVVPPGGFAVPVFDVPYPTGRGYCTSIANRGCESGTGLGAGALWDGGGDAGRALSNVTQRGDTSDGVCNPAGQICDVTEGTGAGSNVLGDVDITREASRSSGLRGTLDIPLRSFTWEDSDCDPNVTPGCCGAATFDEIAGDLVITSFDFILSPTTDVAMSEFVDKNGDGCRAARESPAPDHNLRSLVGMPLPGPCCALSQRGTIVAGGVAFSGLEPLNDLAFQLVMPVTVSGCGPLGAPADCTVTTDACQH